MSTAQAERTAIALRTLEEKAKRMQDNSNAWKCTMGVPGARYWPEIERLEAALLDWTLIAGEADALRVMELAYGKV